MKNTFKLSIATAIALSTSAMGSDDLKARMDAMEAKLNAATAEIASLKSGMKSGMTKELDAVDSRIDTLETAVLSNKVKFGFGMKTRMDNFAGKTAGGNHFYNNNVWSSKFNLNMDAKITEDMKFTGRLSMYKDWAQNNGRNEMYGMDSVQGRRPIDSSVFVERAYLDWTLNRGSIVPVTLTIGRQPSSDGPSHQFKDNTVRKSTYSALAFDGAADGIVTTFNLEKITGLPEAGIRLAYGKGYQTPNTATSSYVNSNSGKVDTNFFAMFIDGSVPGVEGSLLQLGYVNAKNVNMTGTPIGDVVLTGAMAEFTNIKNSGLDYFIHYGVSKSDSNGVSDTMTLASGSMPLGTMTDGTGNAIWTGARYTFSGDNASKIGFEYNKGSKNWVNFTQGSNDILNKLATRGTAWEGYYIHPINRYAHIRAGVQNIQYDYTMSGYPHAGGDIDSAQAIAAGAVKSLTNYYLMMGVLF